MTDDDLRARMRDADPAASLTPLTPDRVSRLLENTMTSTVQPVDTGRRWLVATAAAIIVIAAAAGIFFLKQTPNPHSGTVAAAPTATPHQTVTRLTVPANQAKCMAPTADILNRGADLAFEGTVIGIKGDTVVLMPSKHFRGSGDGVIEIPQTSGATEALLGGTTFETGQKYLVAANQGQILVCGYSGVASPELETLYNQAF
jgi:hypothetical protein